MSIYDLSICSVKATNQIGYQVGNYLILVKSKNDIYWDIISKFGIFQFRNFDTVDDAQNFAELLDKTYSEFFLLWKDCPELDLYRITMWTVPDGLRLYETIEALREQPKITLQTINNLYLKSTGNKYKYVCKSS